MLVEGKILETGLSFSNAVPAPPERRTDERLIKILRVGILVLDGRRELCLIRNIAAGGLMAHVYSRVVTGQSVTVELKTGQPIAGRVVWVRDTNAGIQFDRAMDLVELLATPPVGENGWRPRTPRVEIDRPATLRAGARTERVRACDISQSGVKVEGGQCQRPGAEVVVTLEGFRSLHGVVRWERDGAAGIAFNQVIPFADLIGWLKQGG